MIDERERFEEAFELFERPEPAWDRFLGRRDRKRRNQRIAAGVVGLAVFVVAVLIVGTVGLSDRTQAPAGGTQTGPAQTGPDQTSATETGPTEIGTAEAPGETGPEWRGLYDSSVTDYVVDLDTGATSPLPESIVGGVDRTTDYAVSPDGSRLAYVGPDANRERQIFVANLDGTEIEPVTEGLRGDARPAGWPAWSPDGSKIAYVGSGGPHGWGGHVYVLDLATGVSTQVTFDPREVSEAPSFSRDGSSIVYSVYREDGDQVKTVPAAGGASVTLLGGDGAYAQDPALSPDGSLLSFLCGDVGKAASGICVANADGSGARVFLTWAFADDPEWSPDGTRIAFWTFRSGVYIVDAATGKVTTISTGGASPTWLDDHTLIVQADYCNWPSLPQCPG